MTTLYEEVRAALREPGFRPRKRLGQNFLIRADVIDAIVRLLDLAPGDEVLEIGPGLGFLTRRLLERGARVWAVEVDPFLVRRLRASEIGARPDLEIVAGDILKVSFADLLPPRPVKVAGNLPYSISTPVLFRLIEHRARFSRLVLMLQKEVADRIASGPGTKRYGALSVLCQAYLRIAARIPVAPEAFFPRPKVRSAILSIEPHRRPVLRPEESERFRAVVRACFSERRKTIANNLARWLGIGRSEIEDVLRAAAVNPGRRAETLSVEEFVGLTRALAASGRMGA
ncbi:MAG TPA: 16S rRNA (adenine(1518)-N(6)/adenine(1519)-N(6))-dimethyltransferase RsmA [candidate division Zixibacteria bacterium]|nr:16S rRNA (adenine(1518)-N(6)/adenine(1519)-N(6))-dimethyltransferase RsmA [candidate division Zixibacteria bacterium]